jgi:hypothetical protein
MEVPDITLREYVASFEVDGVCLMPHLAGAGCGECFTDARKKILQECVTPFQKDMELLTLRDTFAMPCCSGKLIPIKDNDLVKECRRSCGCGQSTNAGADYYAAPCGSCCLCHHPQFLRQSQKQIAFCHPRKGPRRI